MFSHHFYLCYLIQQALSDYIADHLVIDVCALGYLIVTQVCLQIFELLEQSKGCDTSTGEAEGRQEFEEELANLVTGGGLQPTRSYVNRRLNVYYSALRACGELGNIEVSRHDNEERREINSFFLVLLFTYTYVVYSSSLWKMWFHLFTWSFALWHVKFLTCIFYGWLQAVEKIIEMLKQDNHQLDATCVTELVR